MLARLLGRGKKSPEVMQHQVQADVARLLADAKPLEEQLWSAVYWERQLMQNRARRTERQRLQDQLYRDWFTPIWEVPGG